MGALKSSPTHHAIHSYKAIQCIVRIDYKGAGVVEPHSPSPGEQAVPGLILDKSRFFFIVDFQCFIVRLSTIGVQEGQAGERLRYGGP